MYRRLGPAASNVQRPCQTKIARIGKPGGEFTYMLHHVGNKKKSKVENSKIIEAQDIENYKHYCRLWDHLQIFTANLIKICKFQSQKLANCLAIVIIVCL